MAENERLGVMNEGWLEDRLGLLTNHYLTLMQVEVDRYQDTVRIVKDYYKATEGMCICFVYTCFFPKYNVLSVGPSLDFTIHIGSTPTFLYLDLCLNHCLRSTTFVYHNKCIAFQIF